MKSYPLLLALLAVASVHSADLTRDKSTGCRVLVPYPQPNETVSWTGACVRGKASGTGVLTASNSTRLEGEFREGKPYNAHGQETILNNAGLRTLAQATYRDGVGYAYNPIAHEVGDRESKCLVWDFGGKWNDTVVWTGACVYGRASGEGKASWSNNGVFIASNEGLFVDGAWSHKGRLVRDDGRVFEGEFRDRDFFGKVAWPDGSHFEGQFRNLEPYNATGRKSAGPGASGAGVAVMYKEGVWTVVEE